MLLYKKTTNAKSHWSVIITSEKVNLDQSERRKINSHSEIYTKSTVPLLLSLSRSYNTLVIALTTKGDELNLSQLGRQTQEK